MNEEMKRPCEEDEQEINLVEVMVQLLHSWKKILLCAVILGVLLGGFRTVKGLVSLQDTEAVQEAAENYESELEAYETQKALLESQIDSTTESIQQNEKYSKNSVLMQLDPYDYANASLTWYVDAHYTVDPSSVVQSTDPSGRLVRAYEAKLQNADFYQFLSEQLNGELDSRALQELVSVSAERDTCMVSVNVAAKTIEQVQLVQEAVEQYMAVQKEIISEKIAAHDLQLLSSFSYWVRSDKADGKDATMNASGNFVASKQQEFQNNVDSLNQTLRDLKQQEEELEKPEKSSLSKRGTLKAAVKFGVIGAFGGAFVACGWIFLVMLFADKFTDEQELQQRYGIFLLGSLKRFSTKGAMAKLCGMLSGDAERQADLQGLAALADANVQSRLALRGAADAPVMLVGSDEKKLAALAEALNAAGTADRYQVGGDILKDGRAVSLLQAKPYTVVCEEKGSVSRTVLGNAFAKLKSLDVPVLGFISL